MSGVYALGTSHITDFQNVRVSDSLSRIVILRLGLVMISWNP